MTKLRTEPNSFEFTVFLNSATIAHELGHTIGMSDLYKQQTCKPNGNFGSILTLQIPLMFLSIEVYENFIFTFFSIFNVRFVSLFVQINYDMIKDRTNIY